MVSLLTDEPSHLRDPLNAILLIHGTQQSALVNEVCHTPAALPLLSLPVTAQDDSLGLLFALLAGGLSVLSLCLLDIIDVDAHLVATLGRLLRLASLSSAAYHHLEVQVVDIAYVEEL